jgi:hypothetical protein
VAVSLREPGAGTFLPLAASSRSGERYCTAKDRAKETAKDRAKETAKDRAKDRAKRERAKAMPFFTVVHL